MLRDKQTDSKILPTPADIVGVGDYRKQLIEFKPPPMPYIFS